VITRLGINQFWYKHWYTDTSTMYARQLHQDRAVERLLRIYLSYGLTYQNNPMCHEYWHDNSNKQGRLSLYRSNMRFFRRFFYTNDIVGIEHSYFIRNFSGDHFPFKLWILRYMGWFIVSIHWFKPVKWKKSIYRRRSNTNKFAFSVVTNSRKPSYTRLRLYISLYLRNTSQINTHYEF
jgi:hypothetical protein